MNQKSDAERKYAQLAVQMTELKLKLERYENNEKYGDEVQPATGPIRADLLGNMWAQEWGNI